MGSLFYTTGQTARALATTQDVIRRLCQSGVIAAEVTPGGQWRVPAETLARLKREGIPAIPRPLPDGHAPTPNPAAETRNRATLLAAPSAYVIDSAESVAILANEVQALELRQQKETRLDWFRQREKQEEAARAEDQRLEVARVATEQRQRQHERWLQDWEAFGLQCLPADAPPEVRLKTHQTVRLRLEGLSPLPADGVTQQLVAAEVGAVLSDWRREQLIEEMLLEARDKLLPSAACRQWSWDPLTDWQIRALRAAGAAISELREEATQDELRAAVLTTVRGVEAEFQDEALRKMVCNSAIPQELTPEGREMAIAAIRDSIAQVPKGSPKLKLEKARDEALAPFRAAIARHREEQTKQQEKEQLEREAPYRRAAAVIRAEGLLFHVPEYLGDLEEQGALEFDDSEDRWRTAQKLKERIRSPLIEQLLTEPNIADIVVKRRIHDLIDNHLDGVLNN